MKFCNKSFQKNIYLYFLWHKINTNKIWFFINKKNLKFEGFSSKLIKPYMQVLYFKNLINLINFFQKQNINYKMGSSYYRLQLLDYFPNLHLKSSFLTNFKYYYFEEIPNLVYKTKGYEDLQNYFWRSFKFFFLKKEIYFYYTRFFKTAKSFGLNFYKNLFFLKINRQKILLKDFLKKDHLIFNYVLSIFVKKNNLFVLCRNIQGPIIFQMSAGMLGVKGKKKKTPLVATNLTRILVKFLLDLFKNNYLHFRRLKTKLHINIHLKLLLQIPIVKSFFFILRENKIPISMIIDKITHVHGFGVKKKKLRRV